jgi:cytochrome c-type biogenesis protein CcmH/NrfG
VEATAAMKTRPGNANYLDTLAYALRKGGKFDQAKARLEAAIQLEPANPAWHLSLAELLLESSDRAGAAQAVSVVEEIQAGGFELSEGDRDRLARVRSAVR